MTITNLDDARRSPVTVVERRIAEIEFRMTQIRESQAVLTKEGNELFRERSDLEGALAALKKLVERDG